VLTWVTRSFLTAGSPIVLCSPCPEPVSLFHLSQLLAIYKVVGFVSSLITWLCDPLLSCTPDLWPSPYFMSHFAGALSSLLTP
jgi:hypothetical protein